MVNSKWTLARRPEGVYDPALDTTLVTEQVSLEDCPEDKVIVKVEMLSVDAFIRTMMDEEAYHGVGAVVPAIGYGTIVAAGSQSGKSVGQKVLGSVGAQTYATVPDAWPHQCSSLAHECGGLPHWPVQRAAAMEEMCPSHTWPKPLASFAFALSAGAISSWALRMPRLSLAAQAFSLVALLRAAWEAWPHRPKSPEEQESLARAEVEAMALTLEHLEARLERSELLRQRLQSSFAQVVVQLEKSERKESQLYRELLRIMTLAGQSADDACEAGGDPADAPAVPAVPGFTFAPGTPEGASLDRPSLSSGDEETEEDSEETDAFEGDEEEREQLDGATEVDHLNPPAEAEAELPELPELCDAPKPPACPSIDESIKPPSEVGGMRGVHPFMKIPLHRPEAMLNLFGLTTGLTAYMGIFKVLSAPASHETCVVSAAAGAVGCLAAQLAKSNGARVIGIAGAHTMRSPTVKDTLQLDGAVDYKSEIPMGKQLDEIAPDGVDFFFDNVGGQTLDVILDRIRAGGRVVICGAVSQYSGNLNKGKVEGPRNYLKLAERGATMKGFNVMQYMSSVPGAMCQLAWLHYRGYLRIHEDIQEGIEAFPNALQKLFIGGHTGKMLCRVASET
ncbi:Putative NADP-dependent oxidoreductase YfmJ [Durusdinium trenchii]|uniref:NADP-dependent oxidoreductase YfmJ n=1 Tax=Durusdinium trenchii TaxID=1381693 RepID=A0ABP0S2W6_9DINO